MMDDVGTDDLYTIYVSPPLLLFRSLAVDLGSMHLPQSTRFCDTSGNVGAYDFFQVTQSTCFRFVVRDV